MGGVRRVDQSLKMRKALHHAGSDLTRMKTFNDINKMIKQVHTKRGRYHTKRHKKMNVQTDHDIRFESIIRFAHTRTAKNPSASALVRPSGKNVVFTNEMA